MDVKPKWMKSKPLAETKRRAEDVAKELEDMGLHWLRLVELSAGGSSAGFNIDKGDAYRLLGYRDVIRDLLGLL